MPTRRRWSSLIAQRRTLLNARGPDRNAGADRAVHGVSGDIVQSSRRRAGRGPGTVPGGWQSTDVDAGRRPRNAGDTPDAVGRDCGIRHRTAVNGRKQWPQPRYVGCCRRSAQQRTREVDNDRFTQNNWCDGPCGRSADDARVPRGQGAAEVFTATAAVKGAGARRRARRSPSRLTARCPRARRTHWWQRSRPAARTRCGRNSLESRPQAQFGLAEAAKPRRA